MTKKILRIAVFGGTGFIGRHLIRRLAQDGHQLVIASRNPEDVLPLKPSGSVGQIVGKTINYQSDQSISDILKDCDAVVNLIGVLQDSRRQSFDFVHHIIPAKIAAACHMAGIEHFVHLSAIGASETSKSRYAKSKALGERDIFKAVPHATVLRPSIVFGPDDDFFNRFARMAQITPILPLIGGGKTRFQPVYVGDVVSAITQALTTSPSQKFDPRGRIYELGGPEICSFKTLLDKLQFYTGIKCRYATLPFWIASLQARFLSLLPYPPMTPDQVRLLRQDNVVDQNASTLKDLGLQPTAMDVILPTYLQHYKSGGRFWRKKAA